MKLPPSAVCRRRFTFVNRHQFPIFKKQNLSGGADRDRTCDLLNANQALSQLSYSPKIIGTIDQVGLRGLEPRTSALSAQRSNHLSYKPKIRVCDGLADCRFDLSRITPGYSFKRR